MPRRRYVRDRLGRFADAPGGGSKAKGRAPALKMRSGKNAKRRFASSQMLRASLARRAHEDFIEKNQGKEQTELRKSQLGNARKGIERERAKMERAGDEIAIERGKAMRGRERINRSAAKKAQTPSRPQRKGLSPERRRKIQDSTNSADKLMKDSYRRSRALDKERQPEAVREEAKHRSSLRRRIKMNDAKLEGRAPQGKRARGKGAALYEPARKRAAGKKKRR